MANAYAALTGMEAPVEEHMFEDVEGDPNADDIARISPNGLEITTGTSATTYSPGDPVLRGHMALFLTRLYKAVTGEDAPAGDTPFTDIGDRPDSEQAAIGSLFELEVTRGTSTTTYSPHSNVTREQMASFVARMYRAIDEMPDPTEAPGAPTGVMATPHGTAGTALEVTWSAPEDSGTSDVTGYVVQWGADYNSQQTTSETSAAIFGLTKGMDYSVRVAAVSDDGQGEWAMATGTPGTTPGMVSDLRAEPGASPGTINVMWTAPADDGGTPLTGYMILWAQGNNEQQSMTISNPGATSYTLSGLNSAGLYYVWVKAVNGAGDGEASAAASATPTGNVPSGTVKVNPTSGNDAGKRFASMSWPTVTAKAGQGLDNYTIQRKCGSQLWPDAIIPNDVSRIVMQDAVTTAANQVLPVDHALLGGPVGSGTLINGVECTYRVRANVYTNTNGNDRQDSGEPNVGVWVEGKATPAASTAAPAPGVDVVPAAPEGVGVIAGNRTMQVNWTLVPATSQGTGGSISGYRVTLFSPFPVPVASVTVSAITESHMFTGLTNGWTYTANVVALNPKGAGASNDVTAQAAMGIPGAAQGAPTNVRVTQGTTRGTTLKVAWNAPAANSLATVTGYTLQWRISATARAAAGGWADTSTTPPGGELMPTSAMVEVAGLTAGTSYDFRVRATGTRPNPDSPGSTLDATGPWSAVASGAATGLPAAATNVAVTGNDGSLTLAWTPADGNGSDVTSYSLVYRRNAGEGYNPPNTVSVPASLLPTKTITGLTNGVEYEILITSRNANGSSQQPAKTTGTPEGGGGSLAAPSSVKATVVPVVNADGTIGSNAQINVSWNAVSRATGYTVQFLPVLSNATPPVPGNPADDNWSSDGVMIVPRTTTAVITGLAYDATYVVRVRAATPQGRWGFSAAARTESAPSTAPSVSVVNIAGTTTLRVNWTSLNAMDSRTQGVTGYKVSWGPTEPTVPGNRGTATVAAPANAGSGMPMSYDITGLTAIGQPIRVTVAAVNKIGAGAQGMGTYPSS